MYIPNYVTTPVGINAELTKISLAIAECLQRNATSPMLVDLDVNNNNVLNLPPAVNNTDPVRLLDLTNYVSGTLIPMLERDYGLGNAYDPAIWNAKQNTLVSGVNIKTINNQSLLGSGNITITGGGGGGSSVHNDLTDRDASDAHPISSITGLQTALDSKAASSHTHSISNVTGLQTALDSKASSSHTHAISDVVNLQTALDSKAAVSHTHAISDVTGLQTSLDSKAASSHTHTIANVTGLQTALDSKAASTHSHVINDVTGLQLALDAKATESSDLKRIRVGTTAPADTSLLWLDTN